MANYSYNSNGIDFTIQDNDFLQFKKIRNSSSSIKYGKYTPLINSVEIDWNNAYLGNSYYINTTGEKNAI